MYFLEKYSKRIYDADFTVEADRILAVLGSWEEECCQHVLPGSSSLKVFAEG